MLEVVEMVGWDGPIRIERLVAVRADEELHSHGNCGATYDQEELKVPV